MQQKLFRIEQMARERRAPAAPHPASTHSQHAADEPAALKRELAHLRDAFARNARDLSALLADGKEQRMARAAGELGAVVDALEKAAEQILKSAEVIDDYAKTLASSQMSEYERSLTLDIQDNVARIYEACNFQDLTGQRIGKVIETLGLTDERLNALVKQNRFPGKVDQTPVAEPARELINGPKLDGDSGHATQHDIDTMFG